MVLADAVFTTLIAGAMTSTVADAVSVTLGPTGVVPVAVTVLVVSLTIEVVHRKVQISPGSNASS